MLNKLNQILFTIISTSWTLVVYGIQQKWTLFNLNIFISSIILIVSPIFLTFIWLLTANKFLPNENISGGCTDIEEANNDFLADYLGYFFIGIGIDEFKVLIMIYTIIFIFTYISQSKCYNPLLLIFKYKFYNILSPTFLHTNDNRYYRDAPLDRSSDIPVRHIQYLHFH